MDKFEKRLHKISKNHNNAVVIGTVFGNLEMILSIYNTVFVLGENSLSIKAKNLVFRENIEKIDNLTEVDAIFFDLNKIDLLENFKVLWQRNESKVVVEGNDPIGREFSKPFYDTGWGCTSLQGNFHIWEKIK